jgi:hypothetical protein
MKSILRLLKKHTIAIIFYILYTSICIRIIQLTLDKNSAIHGPDGGLLVIFITLFALMFVITNIIKAILVKPYTHFYLLLSVIIIMQTVVVWNLESYFKPFLHS